MEFTNFSQSSELFLSLGSQLIFLLSKSKNEYFDLEKNFLIHLSLSQKKKKSIMMSSHIHMAITIYDISILEKEKVSHLSSPFLTAVFLLYSHNSSIEPGRPSSTSFQLTDGRI